MFHKEGEIFDDIDNYNNGEFDSEKSFWKW